MQFRRALEQHSKYIHAHATQYFPACCSNALRDGLFGCG